MSENDASESTEQATVTETAVSPFGADGTLAEGWQKQAPEGYEDLREDKTLETIKNIWDFSKSHVHMRKQVPMEKMPRPNDNWGEDDWNEFYDAGGRPATAADLGIQRHPDISEEVMPDKMITGFQELFHKIGLNQKQVDAIVKHNDDMTLATMVDKAKVDGHNHDVMMDALYKEFGQATEQRTRWSNGAIDRGTKGNEELKAFIREKMNTENDVVPWSIFLSNIESNFAEHGEFADPHIDSPKDIQGQINEVMANPRYSSTDLSVRKPLMEQVNRLFEQLSKSKK